MKNSYIQPSCDVLFVAAQEILSGSGASADPHDKKPIVGGGLSAPLRTIPFLKKI